MLCSISPEPAAICQWLSTCGWGVGWDEMVTPAVKQLYVSNAMWFSFDWRILCPANTWGRQRSVTAWPWVLPLCLLLWNRKDFLRECFLHCFNWEGSLISTGKLTKKKNNQVWRKTCRQIDQIRSHQIRLDETRLDWTISSMFRPGCLSREKQILINTQQNLSSEFTEEAALFSARRRQNLIHWLAFRHDSDGIFSMNNNRK